MTKRKAAIELLGRACIICYGIDCRKCPCDDVCPGKTKEERAAIAEAWIRDHPSLWDRIKIAIRGKK
jgi:hypothetical protein